MNILTEEHKRNIDMLISYYSNMEVFERFKGYAWTSSRCFGGVLDMCREGHSKGMGASIAIIVKKLGVSEPDATRLFYLACNTLIGMHQFERHEDPVGWVISILENLRDTGEVKISA